VTAVADLSAVIDLPVCAKGLGDVVTSAGSGRLIDGVEIESSALWPDDRGYFQELFRMGRGAMRSFTPTSTQVSAAMSYPGIIKAFHFHWRQTDVWAPLTGTFQIALVDLRPESPTFGRKNTIYVGEHRPWRILIPPGVGHGYKVVSPTAGILVYATDRFYDPSDEGRIPYDDSAVAYDWATQHK
jgi:dTDP-4-dehydrorhamnose 3,5-epimerase